MNETDKALELLEEMRPHFFCINILSWDHTEKRYVQCDPRCGHDEHPAPLIGEGDSISEAICDAYIKWKK